MNKNRVLCVICCPTRWSSDVVPGSIKTNCKWCGDEVWLAPSSVAEIAKAEKYVILCNNCAIDAMIEHGGEVLPPNEAQLRELEEWRKGNKQITG